jgi:hypothetical protein
MHRVVLTFSQTECDEIQCKVHRNMRVACTTCKTSAATGRLSTTGGICSPLRTWCTESGWLTVQRIPWNVPVSRSLRSTERKVRRFDTLHLGHYSLYLLTASVVFPLNSPTTRYMSANAGNEIATSHAAVFPISLQQCKLGKAHYVLMQCGKWLFISWIRRH